MWCSEIAIWSLNSTTFGCYKDPIQKDSTEFKWFDIYGTVTGPQRERNVPTLLYDN